MMKKGTKRSVVFFLLLGVASYLLYGLDRQMLFAYMPYWIALLASAIILLPLVPSRPWIPKLCALLAFAVWLLVVLPRTRSSELKGFYVNSWSLTPGMTIVQVDEIMAKYEKNPLNSLYGAHMVGVSESETGHQSRIIYMHKEHPADWCVAYPKDGIVERVVIHPD